MCKATAGCSRSMAKKGRPPDKFRAGCPLLRMLPQRTKDFLIPAYSITLSMSCTWGEVAGLRNRDSESKLVTIWRNFFLVCPAALHWCRPTECTTFWQTLPPALAENLNLVTTSFVIHIRSTRRSSACLVHNGLKPHPPLERDS